MSNESIMLAKKFVSADKLEYPVQITEKLDGVAGKFVGYLNGRRCAAVSRQHEELLSVDHIRQYLRGRLPKGHQVIGELYIEGEDFKEIGGLVRRKDTSDETRKLSLYIYDYVIEGEDHEYQDRMRIMLDTLGDIHGGPVKLISGAIAHDAEQFNKIMDAFRKTHPDSEGVMIRSLRGKNSLYKEGWRSPGMLKYKTTETADLKIHSFEEAVDKDGKPKGMVGRINVHYRRLIIGVGPGKLTHRERTQLFTEQDKYIGKTIEVAYMPDESYDALREPRFHRFRPDKD